MSDRLIELDFPASEGLAGRLRDYTAMLYKAGAIELDEANGVIAQLQEAAEVERRPVAAAPPPRRRRWWRP